MTNKIKHFNNRKMLFLLFLDFKEEEQGMAKEKTKEKKENHRLLVE